MSIGVTGAARVAGSTTRGITHNITALSLTKTTHTEVTNRDVDTGHAEVKWPPKEDNLF
jgi:hypothetical protein